MSYTAVCVPRNILPILDVSTERPSLFVGRVARWPLAYVTTCKHNTLMCTYCGNAAVYSTLTEGERCDQP